MRIQIPVCCPDLKGVKSEKSLETHINQLLSDLGMQVTRQKTIVRNDAKITIDLEVKDKDSLFYIEVKYNNFGASMVRGTGQVKWYEFITERTVYLTFACNEFAQLMPSERKFLKSQAINICVVKENSLEFISSEEIESKYGTICEKESNFRGYREVTLEGGQIFY